MRKKYTNKPLNQQEINLLFDLKNDDERIEKFPNHSINFLRKELTNERKRRNLKNRKSKLDTPLTEEQLNILIRIKDEGEYLDVFPNHSRQYLRKQKKKYRDELGLDRNNKLIETTIEQDLLLGNKDKLISKLSNKNKELIREMELLRKENDIVQKLRNDVFPQEVSIVTSNKSVTSAVVVQCSDWHIEETVTENQVSGLNRFDLSVADKRMNQLVNVSKEIIDTIILPYNIQTLILPLQGDFISGNIHDELLEGNSLLPGDAILKAQNMLIGLIDFYIENTTIPEIMIVVSSGNHGRMTKKQRISTELGNSLEHYMYNILFDRYRENNRINFNLQQGYHTIVDVYGTKVRFHHGHFIRYGGGVGGITIPVNKAISQWNKTKNVDLDVFGHFHQTLNHKNFVCNGSLIGYNAYAVSIKAEYEPPSQNLFVIDSKRGKTLFTPIVLD